MGETTGIGWTDATLNPWRGCSKVAPECANCYAATMSKRSPSILGTWGPSGTRVVAAESYWKLPERWQVNAAKDGRQIRVFCCSLADVFELWEGPMISVHGKRLWVSREGDQSQWIEESEGYDFSGMRPLTMDDVRWRLFRLIDATPNLIWQLLTKRPENILSMWPETPVGAAERDAYHPYPSPNGFLKRHNVWLGTSAGCQASAERFVPELMKCGHLSPCLFVSCEPLLGPTYLRCLNLKDGRSINALNGQVLEVDRSVGQPLTPIRYVIGGGESGHGARACHPDWARMLRDQCDMHETAFYWKQWGESVPYEESTPPMLESQHGDFMDGHHLPEDLDLLNPSGQWRYEVFGPLDIDTVLFRKVGVSKAGRLLDGRIHDGVPYVAQT